MARERAEEGPVALPFGGDAASRLPWLKLLAPVEYVDWEWVRCDRPYGRGNGLPLTNQPPVPVAVPGDSVEARGVRGTVVRVVKHSPLSVLEFYHLRTDSGEAIVSVARMGDEDLYMRTLKPAGVNSDQQ